jgi:hypothetical protein
MKNIFFAGGSGKTYAMQTRLNLNGRTGGDFFIRTE